MRTHSAILVSRSPELSRCLAAKPDEPVQLAAGMHLAGTPSMRQIALPIAAAVVRDFVIFLVKDDSPVLRT